MLKNKAAFYKMQKILPTTSIILIFISHSVIASEVTKCFEGAWRHLGNGELGLTRGSAIELCN